MISDEFIKTAASEDNIGTKRGKMLASLQVKYLNQGYTPKEANKLAIEEYNRELQKIKQSGTMTEEEWLSTAKPLPPTTMQVSDYIEKHKPYGYQQAIEGAVDVGILGGIAGALSAPLSGAIRAKQTNTSMKYQTKQVLGPSVALGSAIGATAGGLGYYLGTKLQNYELQRKIEKLTPEERTMVMNMSSADAYDYLKKK